jgi:hypothetical protein
LEKELGGPQVLLVPLLLQVQPPLELVLLQELAQLLVLLRIELVQVLLYRYG